MSKKLPINGFKWLDNDKINEKFISVLKNYTTYVVIYRSYLKEWK